MSVMTEWLVIRENRAVIGDVQVLLIVHELRKHPVAIRAGNIFSITYSVAAEVMLCSVNVVFVKYKATGV